ncbi:MAG: hypothetical protein C4326_04215 [Ignavibacteria bacterium]
MRMDQTAFLAFIVLSSATLVGCSKQTRPTLSAEDSLAIVRDNERHRAAMDEFFRNDPESPFRRDTSVRYEGLTWYPIDPQYCGKSVLHRYEHPETVIVFGTKGEERRNLRYGYFEFDVPDENGSMKRIRLNVYKFTPYDAKRYALYRNVLSVWFTDKTTGTETYHVGRYVEIGEEHPDPGHVYTIDLNKAYTPYCAYSDLYSCAIPRKEDHLDVAIRAGEKTYHH